MRTFSNTTGLIHFGWLDTKSHQCAARTSELRKTARSVPYNIAEGHQRRTTVEYLRLLDIASGSRGELET